MTAPRLTKHQAEVLWAIGRKGADRATPQRIGSRGACQHLQEKGYAAFNGRTWVLTDLGVVWFERAAKQFNAVVDVDSNLHDRAGQKLTVGDTVRNIKTNEVGTIDRFFRFGPMPQAQTRRGSMFPLDKVVKVDA